MRTLADSGRGDEPVFDAVFRTSHAVMLLIDPESGRIVDANGADVAVGESGEIWMRGAGLTPGYWRRPEETAKALTADGWLKSGDIGRRDADGCYYVAGRIKEMYISGAENVYPAEIENVLARHPSVLEAAIIGVPDEKWGEVGHAFVQLRPGAAAITVTEVIQFCRVNLAGYKTPRHVTFVDEFTRTAAGKIRKHLLSPAPNARRDKRVAVSYGTSRTAPRAALVVKAA